MKVLDQKVLPFHFLCPSTNLCSFMQWNHVPVQNSLDVKKNLQLSTRTAGLLNLVLYCIVGLVDI